MKGHGQHAMLWAVTTALALAAAFVAPLSPPSRAAALLGVALSAAGGGLAALLIDRAQQGQTLSVAMLAISVPFAVRVLLVLAGVLAVVRSEQTVPFLVAFFGLFFTQLLLDIFQVLARQSRAHTAMP